MSNSPGRWRQFVGLAAGERNFSPLLRLGVASFLSFALLLMIGLTWQQMRVAGQDYPGTSHALAPLPDVRLGVNADLQQYDASGLERALDRVQEAGFGWVRQTFPWAEIEPQRGRFEWAPWDAIVERASERGLRLVAVLDAAPAWAQSDPALARPQPVAPPHEVADWGRFVRAFAARYGKAVDFYQVWDEPNLSEHWGGAYVDPTAYVRLLREGYIQIKAADPSAMVILAGLAPTVESGPLNLNEPAFLEGVYAAGGAEFFDVVAAKPYGLGRRADDAPADVNVLNFGRVELLRRVMEAHGDAARPLWAVAFGWNALPAGWQGRPSIWGSDTEAVQAADTAAAIERARRQWPWLGVMFLSHLQPDVSPDDSFLGFSLLDGDGRPRPVYDAVRTLASTPPVAWPGRYRPDHPSARYVGDWRVTAAGADIPAGADAAGGDARLVIPFYGTRLDLTVRRGDFWGVLYVTVDGRPANRLPRDAQGRAYLVLYDPLHETASVTLAASLSDGSHQAVIAPDGGWGQWAIAGWTVGREPVLTAYCLVLVSLALALAACLVVTGVYLYRARSLLFALYASLVTLYTSLPEGWQLALLAFAAAVFYFAPGLPPGLMALVLLALLVLLRPDHGLALVALSVPFFLRPRLLAGKAFSLVEVGVLLCFAAWLVRKAHNAQCAVHNSQFAIRNSQSAIRHLPSAICHLVSADWAVAALAALGAVSLAWADNFGVASREFRVVVFEAGLFYLLLRTEANRVGNRLYRLVVDALAAGAVAVSFIALWQYFIAGDVITAEGVRRVRALYGSPNNLALFLERVLPLLVAVAWWGSNRRRRVFYTLAIPPVLAALLLTFSRGALFLGLPATALFMGLMRGRRAMWLALAALILLTLALLPFAGAERLANTFDLAGGTAFFRLKLWQSAVNMIADHPLTGVGLDNFLYAYRTRYVLPAASDELNLSHPHNAVLDFWTRLGLGGAALLVWLLAAFFRAGLRRYRRLPEGDDRALILGLLAGMVAALAHGLIDQIFFLVDLAFVFMLALAAVSELPPHEQEGLKGIRIKLRSATVGQAYPEPPPPSVLPASGGEAGSPPVSRGELEGGRSRWQQLGQLSGLSLMPMGLKGSVAGGETPGTHFLDDAEKATYVNRLFARIAPRYDLMNRLMTGGRDRAWRRLAARLAALPPGGRALDVATGTGDIALALARRYPEARVVGADFSLTMMQTGRPKLTAAGLDGRIALTAGDALRLPFADGGFDAATTGFALRNVTDVPRAFAEMYRVVRPGGRVVCLEISRPTLPLFRSLFNFYFYRVVPWLGGLISGQKDAYAYLPRSLIGFLTPQEVKAVMERAGWRQVRYRRLMLGTVAIHVGVKE